MPWEADPEGRGYTYRRPFKRELRTHGIAVPTERDIVGEQLAAPETDAPRKRVAGDGLGKLRKGEQYTKADA